MDDISVYLGIWAGLVGLGMVISFIVSILKYTGIIVDGTSDKWAAGLNLVGILAVIIVVNFFPQVNLPMLDEKLVGIMGIVNYFFSYVLTILGSKLGYFATKGLPIIGKSFSLVPPKKS